MTRVRLTVGVVATGLVMTGLLGAQPAAAAAGDSVECTNGSYGAPGYSIRCLLETSTGQSQQAWKINGVSYGPGAGAHLITFSCQHNLNYLVQVSYVDGNGVSSQASTTDTCGAINP